MLDGVAQLNQMAAQTFGDPEINTRIAQYEMAYRMQASVPDLMDLSKEPDRTFEMYGPDSRKPGTFAANCLLARRLVERGVRFVQLFHRGWDQHGNLPKQIAGQCMDTDQPSAALVQGPEAARPAGRHAGDLGRRVRADGLQPGRADEGQLRPRPPRRCFTHLDGRRRHQAGYDLRRDGRLLLQHLRDPVHIHDLNATTSALLGIDHERLTYPLPGPRLPPHRRLRGSGEEYSGLSQGRSSYEGFVQARVSRRVPRARRLPRGEIAWGLRRRRSPQAISGGVVSVMRESRMARSPPGSRRLRLTLTVTSQGC